MLGAEQGGMNEVLADVYALTNDRKYLALAQRFSHRALLEHLERHEDTLTGLHANTQIPKAIGYARIAELGGDPGGLDAARFFWQTVVRHRTVAFGGNSVREHFNPPDDFSSMIESREGPETCNTYNMLRLTERLFRAEPSAEYADFYERAVFNHILSTEHPVHGGFVYFTPIRPRHYRVYSQPSQCFWCCVGTGMENHGKYGQFIYAHTRRRAVRQPVHRVGAALARTRPRAPAGDELSRTSRARGSCLSLQQPQRFTLRVRHPAWAAADGFAIRVNGQPWRERLGASLVRRDCARVAGRRSRRDRSADADDDGAAAGWVRLRRRSCTGPIVLAARTGEEQLDGLIAGDGRMAHVSPGPYLPLDSAPMLVGDVSTLADRIRPVAGRPMTFLGVRGHSTRAGARSRARALLSSARQPLHDLLARRGAGPVRRRGRQAGGRGEGAACSRGRTIDRVTAGEQQPEVEHHVRSDGSTTGATNGRTWRDASGWFSYELRLDGVDSPRSTRGIQPEPGAPAPSARPQSTNAEPLELLVTYWAGQRDRRFDILVNDRVIASVALDGAQPDRFVDASYAIPADLVRAATSGVLTVTFSAKPGSRAGAVYDVRLLGPR